MLATHKREDKVPFESIYIILSPQPRRRVLRWAQDNLFSPTSVKDRKVNTAPSKRPLRSMDGSFYCPRDITDAVNLSLDEDDGLIVSDLELEASPRNCLLSMTKGSALGYEGHQAYDLDDRAQLLSPLDLDLVFDFPSQDTWIDRGRENILHLRDDKCEDSAGEPNTLMCPGDFADLESGAAEPPHETWVAELLRNGIDFLNTDGQADCAQSDHKTVVVAMGWARDDFESTVDHDHGMGSGDDFSSRETMWLKDLNI
ncbi:hypothetical protein Hypma_014658 [Hypsizygus marmoreus]|uniref:Uncharacterized protein n=1 Tax=Hypsizygus marmoreus TaxID=39966 RepID=A0A369JGV9_HYPMA|nr:hypothetical protein Hypma_014658 [Hypsizygus marmoreus]